MRVYLPATLGMLRQLVSEGELFPVGGTAFAVTPTLREAYAEGDDDELAEVALGEAARASLRLLAAEAPEDADNSQGSDSLESDSQGSLPLRRAVIVADIEPATARPDLDDAVVRVGAPCRLDAVAAVYVDIADAEAAVRAAMAVIDEADLGDEDAELTVGDALDHDLAWYATQELPFLLELL